MYYTKDIDVNIEASKRSNKLVFIRNYSFSLVFKIITDGFTSIVLFCLFPFISIFLLKNNLTIGLPFILSLIFLIITVPFGCISIYGMLAPERLRRIRGISKNKNRELFKKVIKKSGWHTYRGNKEMDIFKKDWKWTSTNYGRELIVIYDDKDILINCIALGRGEIKLHFHWFSNRKIEKKLMQEFENKMHS